MILMKFAWSQYQSASAPRLAFLTTVLLRESIVLHPGSDLEPTHFPGPCKAGLTVYSMLTVFERFPTVGTFNAPLAPLPDTLHVVRMTTGWLEVDPTAKADRTLLSAWNHYSPFLPWAGLVNGTNIVHWIMPLPIYWHILGPTTTPVDEDNDYDYDYHTHRDDKCNDHSH